ncbi:DinB family protein [Calditrichota bacterium]
MEINNSIYINSFVNVDDKTTNVKPKDSINSMLFVAIHLLDARYYLAKIIGISKKFPLKDIFDQAQKFLDISPLPNLDKLVNTWSTIHKQLFEELNKLTEIDLKKNISQKLPVVDQTLLGALTFLLQHESYHIGQLGYLRMYFGFDAVKYS